MAGQLLKKPFTSQEGIDDSWQNSARFPAQRRAVFRRSLKRFQAKFVTKIWLCVHPGWRWQESAFSPLRIFFTKVFKNSFPPFFLAFSIINGTMDCKSVANEEYTKELNQVFTYMAGIVARAFRGDC